MSDYALTHNAITPMTDPTPNKPKPQRRWFQYSLWSLFVLALLVPKFVNWVFKRAGGYA